MRTTSAKLFDAAPVVNFWKAEPQSDVFRVTLIPGDFVKAGSDASIGFGRFEELTASVARRTAVGPTGIADHMQPVSAAVGHLTRLLAHVLATVGCIIVPEAVTLGSPPLLLGAGFFEGLTVGGCSRNSPMLLQSPLGDRASRRGTVMMALDAYIDAL